MAENGTLAAAPFRWTPQRSKAAVLVAENRLTEDQIAQRINGSERQLSRWKQHPDFQGRVEEVRKRLDGEACQQGIARVAERVRAQNDRWERMKLVMAERGSDPDMSSVPGGRTGLLVRQFKSVGSGDTARVVEEYEVDTGLLREFREHEKQAAQELGQWADKHEHRGAVLHLYAHAAELAKRPADELERSYRAEIGPLEADW